MTLSRYLPLWRRDITTTHYCPQPLHHHTKQALPHSVIALLSGSQALVRLLPAILAAAPSAVVLTDARPVAFLEPASLGVVLADTRPAALLAVAPLAVVLADARPAALLALASYAVVLADA